GRARLLRRRLAHRATVLRVADERVIRLVATDLDGTLLRADGSFSKRTLAALGRVQGAGVVVVFVSARSPRTVPLDAERAGVRGYAICGNGAITYDLAERRIVAHRPLRPETATRVVAALREAAPGVAFGCELELDFGHEPTYVRGEPAYPAQVLDALELARRPVTKLVAQHRTLPLAELLALASGSVGGEAVVTVSGTQFVEVNAPGVTKAAAVEDLAERLPGAGRRDRGDRGLPPLRERDPRRRVRDVARVRHGRRGRACGRGPLPRLRSRGDHLRRQHDEPLLRPLARCGPRLRSRRR